MVEYNAYVGLDVHKDEYYQRFYEYWKNGDMDRERLVDCIGSA